MMKPIFISLDPSTSKTKATGLTHPERNYQHNACFAGKSHGNLLTKFYKVFWENSLWLLDSFQIYYSILLSIVLCFVAILTNIILYCSYYSTNQLVLIVKFCEIV